MNNKYKWMLHNYSHFIANLPWWVIVVPYLVSVAIMAHLVTNWHWLMLICNFVLFGSVYLALKCGDKSCDN